MSFIPPSGITLATLLQERAQQQPASAALFAPGRPPLSFAELWLQVQDVAWTLQRHGVSSSTRVAIVLPNGPEMATAFLGTAACSVCAPLNPSYRASEFRFYLEDIHAKVLILPKGDRGDAYAVAKELELTVLEVDIDKSLPAGRFGFASAAVSKGSPPTFSCADDVALILHTSGTTARPKIVPLSQSNLVASAGNIAHHLGLRPQDRCLNVMPLFHIHGLVGALLASTASGAGVVCAPGFDELAFFDWIAQFQPSWYTAVPTIHQSVLAKGMLYRQKAPHHAFRFIRSSSSALPPKVFESLQALTGAPVVEAYGMTEASHQMASNPLPPRQCKAGSVGIPAGVEIALMDEGAHLLPPGSTGEIVIRGAGVTAGYQDNPQANAKAFHDGWFRTGDQGRFDEDGYLFISGRLKELINRGGEKISPREIDEALLEHPDVAQAVAFAVPHTSLGEDVAAAVVLRDGAGVIEAQLRSFLFDRLAAFKVPSSMAFVDAIPKGATGKVQRTSLHEKLASRLAKPFVAPRNELELVLEALFREVLDADAIGVDDNFFALGGDSLKGTRVMARVNARLGVELPVATLFRHPSVAQLAVHLTSAAAADAQTLAAEIDQLSDDEVARMLANEDSGL